MPTSLPILGIDASRTTLAQRTGTETYARELIRALLTLSPAERAFSMRLYFRTSAPEGLFSPTAEMRILPAKRLWTHLALAGELARHPVQGLFVPAHVRPLWCPVPSLITLHDLGHLHFPQAHTRWQRFYLHWSTRHAVRNATHLLADSQSTRNDLLAYYHADAQKVSVVYPGFDPRPFRQSKKALPHLPAQYLLHVGTLQPRKNLVRLVQAFEQVQQIHPQLWLILAGRKGWLHEEILARIESSPAHGQIRVLDYVADDDLPGLYAQASLFVFPSLYEGFGFPVLEAMAAGTPVVCSDGGSLPEVAESAALIVPARETEQLADAILRVLGDRALAENLRTKGAVRAESFSWQASAQQVAEIARTRLGWENTR